MLMLLDFFSIDTWRTIPLVVLLFLLFMGGGDHALQKSSTQYANQVSALGAENERLRSQLAALSNAAGGAGGAGGAANDQERRLDEVAQQVVRVLLSQKMYLTTSALRTHRPIRHAALHGAVNGG
ncbi:hypothetical protein EVAR_63003_1 [Eumeta japonica]|uniref:Uncharacterized protein n=1 Tax=Eumeta variegata TaxID=151549 RepID=A0A4C1YRA8_EUMVA|nr:hypothetical protein EVAR_63003_1 [Eumeta japonica]